jgi:1-deoxy-D-xylulose-5-phosphate synthase
VVVHVHTVKGCGYGPAEADEEKRLHDVGPFDVATGARRGTGSDSYTEAFASALVAEAETRPEIVAVTAAMGGPTGLLGFAERFPERYVDVGIAEAHAVTAAAGMAMAGLRPVVAIYSTFLNRAWDQVYFDVGLHRLPVVFCLDRAGITGDDGPSHHGLLDLALLTKVPGMTVLAPSSYDDVGPMLRAALAIDTGPVAIRWPKTPARRATPGTGLAARRLRAGADVCLIGVGKLVAACLDAADRLGHHGVGASVWDARVVAPPDRTMLVEAGRHRLVVVAEDGVAEGGAGSLVAGRLAAARSAARVVEAGVPMVHVPHGPADDLLAGFGLDGAGLAATVLGALDRSSG